MPERQRTPYDIPWPAITQGPVLGHLPPEAVESFYRKGWEKKWQRGEFVVSRGSKVHSAMIVLDGRLRASTMMPGGEENLLGWLKAQELFGVPNVLVDSPFPVDITADGAATTLHVARGDFLDVLQRIPQAAVGVAVMLSHRLAQLFDVIESSGYRSLSDRLLAHLLRLASQHGQQDRDARVVLDIAQGDLAAAVGASRQRVHMELQKLRAAGEIELAYRKIIVLRPAPTPGP